MPTVLVRSGGEGVALINGQTKEEVEDKLKDVKEWVKDMWPDERVTVKWLN